jgi:hypothetical protein
MKKIFTFLSLCLLSITASAQEYVFTDAQGNTYDDGVVINRTEVEDDGFGGINLPGNLFVKNVGAAEGCEVAIVAEITKIDNGDLQLCFPTNCHNQSEVGTYETNEKATLAIGESKNLMTEWTPLEYGECIVTYTAKKYQGFTGEAVRSVTVKYKYSNSQQNWWGYVTGDENSTSVGVSTADTYHCAIFIPGNHAIAAGKTINAVRFRLTATHATNAKVWVSSDLPVTVDASHTLRFVDVPDSKLASQQVDIELPSPVEIPANGIYVGYSFTITSATTTADKYPVLCYGEDAVNTLIIKTDNAVNEWSDLNGNNFGRLFLQVLLEGTFADNNATAGDFGTAYAVLGSSGTATIEVSNAGGTPLSSIDYTITTDGETSAEQHADIATPIAFNTTGKVNITIAADATVGEKAKTLNITKVNGNANASADKAINFTLYTLPELVERKVVVEEFTGTGCGWCPRGLIGMDNLRNTFGDRFVGIGLHQYNSSDAMYIAKSAYASLSFDGAPSCRINRGEELDPYYGSGDDIRNDFAAAMAVPALAKINVSGTIDEELKKVNAKAQVEALLDNSEYTLEFVVIGDGLKGSGSAWNQANNYASYSASQLPDDLAIFGNGGKFGTSTVTGWSFNDVALVSSYVSSSNKAPKLNVLNAGEQQEAEYTLTMPTKTSLKNAVKDAELYIVALLVDKQKHIVNAAKAAITIADPSGIENVNATADNEQTANYTLDGRRVQTTQKGINIVRMANGKTIKVVKK